MQKATHKNPLLLFLLAMHVAGIIGLMWPVSHPYFKSLVPFSLLFTTVAVLWFHSEWNVAFILYILLAFLIGFFIEVVGVRTGVIFGQYQYGEGMGFKVFNVPLIIGVNWVLLSYCAGVIGAIFRSSTVRAFAGAVCMTLLDFAIEPVAIHLDFWHWSSAYVPLQNYIAWFLVSFFILLIFYRLKFRKTNSIAVQVFFIQALFFVLGFALIRWSPF